MRKTEVKAPSRQELRDEFETLAAEYLLNVDVFSSGPTTATIAIVGEGPGETEVRVTVLHLSAVQANYYSTLSPALDCIVRTSYTTNVVKRQISLSRKGNERHVVHRDELDKWLGLVNWELSQLPNVRIIFVMGNFALEALLGEYGITNWRGSVLTDRELPNGKKGTFVCTVNPAYAQRELRLEPVFLVDCGKLDAVVRGNFKPYKVDAIINPTKKECHAFIRDLRKARKPVSLDIEAINDETACIGIGNDPHRAMCINFRNQFENRFSVKEEVDILLDLQKLCESHKIVAQNGSFDAYWTRLHDWLRIRIWFDTLLAHHFLYPQLPHNLGFLTSMYTNHPFYKDDGKNWREGGDIDSFWEYNCKDVAITYRVHERLSLELEQARMLKTFLWHNDPKKISPMRAQPHLVEATVHGVAQDHDVKEIIAQQVYNDVADAEKEIHRIVHELTDDPNYYPNPKSWQQMQALYFEVLGLKGKGTSTDKTNRDHILKNPATSPLERELIVAVNKFAQEDKFRGTYVESRDSQDGRFRTEYKQYGVAKAPGRLSSAQLINGEGGNMQNQPVRARAKFIADPGCVLLYFDLKQAEAQVVGFRADVSKWKADFERARKDGSFDCHRSLAADMWRVPYDETPTKDWTDTNQPTKRYIAKRCRHGLNYRMQEYRLAEVTGLPFHEARSAFQIYHRITPELKKWWKEEERRFRATREIYNAFGRRLKVVQRIDDDVLESIVAFYPQSTIGDKITQTWYMCEDDDDWPAIERARIAIDVHDNLVAIATPQVAKTCLRIMRKHAQAPIWLQDVWKRRPPEPLEIDAELKMSYPTLWDAKAKNKDGSRGAFVEDKRGLHRWSHMKDVIL
jgi:DNA polymerase I-like protein with 3'-5' exonuclease and polymerase domains/uracil-DNA glycosylase